MLFGVSTLHLAMDATYLASAGDEEKKARVKDGSGVIGFLSRYGFVDAENAARDAILTIDAVSPLMPYWSVVSFHLPCNRSVLRRSKLARCYVVWGSSKRIIVLPVILYMGSVGETCFGHACAGCISGTLLFCYSNDRCRHIQFPSSSWAVTYLLPSKRSKV